MRVALLMTFGAAGTLTRYWLQGVVQYRAVSDFPTGTLTVNLLDACCWGDRGSSG